MDYASRPKDKPKQAVPNKKPAIKQRKIKTARTVITAVVTGACWGCTPYVLNAGVDNKWLYMIPITPVIVYLINKVCDDLERWYKNDEV